MKISKAMKRLKKLKNKASSLADKIQKNNRTLEGNDFQYAMEPLISEYRLIIGEIVNIKVSIMKANIESGNYEKVLLVGELKGLNKVLANVDTDEGLDEDSMRYNSSSTVLSYKVQIDAKELEDLTDSIEEEIEGHIEVLDEFNAKTDI
jgi:hypothetical protein